MTSRCSLVVAMCLLVFGVLMSGGNRVAMAASQNRPAQGSTPAAQPGMGDMMKMHEKMMAEMKAGDARLDALVKTMNTANGDAKTNAIAAVVNELVQQHKAMHAHMGDMHQQMMGGRGMMMGK